MIKASSLVCKTLPFDVAYDRYNCYRYIDDVYHHESGDHLMFCGSNHMFRKLDWVGTKEECVNTFGCIPVGAFAFQARSQHSRYACVPMRYYDDGFPDVFCVGFVVHPDELHSKWTHIGLSSKISYNDAIDLYLNTKGDRCNMTELDSAILKLIKQVGATYKIETKCHNQVISETEHPEPYITLTHDEGAVLLEALKQSRMVEHHFLKQALAMCATDDPNCCRCPYDDVEHCSRVLCNNALKYIEELEDECRHVAP